MSDIIINHGKVKEMLDAGWMVRVYKNGMGSYEAQCFNCDESVMKGVKVALQKALLKCDGYKQIHDDRPVYEVVDEFYFDDGWLTADDFTPSQVLTRLAHKIDGEII